MAGRMVTSTTLEKLPHLGTDCAHHSFFWFSKQASHACAASSIPLRHIHKIPIAYTQGQADGLEAERSMSLRARGWSNLLFVFHEFPQLCDWIAVYLGYFFCIICTVNLHTHQYISKICTCTSMDIWDVKVINVMGWATYLEIMLRTQLCKSTVLWQLHASRFAPKDIACLQISRGL